MSRVYLLILPIVITFYSCNRKSPFEHSSSSNTNQKLNYSNVSQYNVHAKPEIFETAFFKNTNVQQDSFHLSFYSVDIGKINIESGKIIACDPIVMHDVESFTQKFPIGKFLVQLSVVKINNDERVAYSRILFSDDSVSRWEFALTPGQKSIPLFSESNYCYGVDAGIGVFVDEISRDVFEMEFDSAKFMNQWDEVFIKGMEQNSHGSWDYNVYNFNGHNLAAFSTGFGDGCYSTYIGFNAKGEPCRLLTDFGIVEW